MRGADQHQDMTLFPDASPFWTEPLRSNAQPVRCRMPASGNETVFWKALVLLAQLVLNITGQHVLNEGVLDCDSFPSGADAHNS
jgi:hypothetical protein